MKMIKLAMGVGALAVGLGAAQNGPPLHAETVPKLFDVGDQVGGGVRREVGVWITRERPTAATTALIEKHGAIKGRVKEPPLTRRAS
jgi:hypothetical protein